MTQPPPKSPSNQSNPNFLRLLLGGATIIVFLLCSIAGYILLDEQGNNLSKTSLPTQACGESTLSFGNSIFRIQTIKRDTNGSLTIPPNTPGIAYLIEDTNPHYVFALSPTKNNQALKDAIKTGEVAAIIWGDCTYSGYVVNAIEPGLPDESILHNTSEAGFLIFIPTSKTAQGYMIKAGLVQANSGMIRTPASNPADSHTGINTPIPNLAGSNPAETAAGVNPPAPGRTETPFVSNIPTANPADIHAEISVPMTSAGQDPNTIRVDLSISNVGDIAFSLTNNNILFTPAGAAAIRPSSSVPALPYEIKPGENATFTFIFPRPVSSTAALKVFDVEFDLEGY